MILPEATRKAEGSRSYGYYHVLLSPTQLEHGHYHRLFSLPTTTTPPSSPKPAHQDSPFAPFLVIATSHAPSCPVLNGMLPPTHPSLPSAGLARREHFGYVPRKHMLTAFQGPYLILCLKRQRTLLSIYPCQRVQRSTIQPSTAAS